MSNYTKTTDFEAKDSLPTGDSGKIIRGAEFETEFDAISTAIATKADTAGPTFTGTLTFETISDGTIGVTAFVDEDDMSSDSATLVPTQQSVKAYVDAVTTELQAQDLDFQADSGGALSIDLDSETLTFTGGTGIDTSGSGNAVTFAIDSTVATLTGTQTLTNKTLTSPDVNTPDIDGGTIDGATIATSDITVGTGKTLDVSSGTLTLADDQISGDKVEGGTIASTTITSLASTTVDTTNLEVTNIKAKDGTSAGSIADSTGVVTLASSVLTTTDINGGTIDGATIGGTTAAAGSFTTVSATGNITVDGTVDGRDVATDGTKLDGIEAGADVTDTTNVTAAGAVMDSELTDETAVKSLDQGVATTDSPTFAGLTTTADVSFGDNDKAIFGAGSDLQLYHDGSTSFIDDVGDGNLHIRTDGASIKLRTSANADMIVAENGGAAKLYHAGSQKLTTLTTGIDVTGTVTADGIDVDGTIEADGTFNPENSNWTNASFKGTGSYGGAISFIDGSAGFANYVLASGSTYRIAQGSTSGALTTHFQIANSGDISFYEDTGTTAKLFWDASSERLGIGNSSPTTALDVSGTVTADGLTLGSEGDQISIPTSAGFSGVITTGDTVSGNAFEFKNGNGIVLVSDTNDSGATGGVDATLIARGSSATKTALFDANGDISFYEDTGTTAKFFWDASAESLGIGTGAPERLLHINSASVQIGALIENTSTVASRLALMDANTTNSAKVGIGATGDTLGLYAGGAARVTVDDSGQVGIGTSSPSFDLDISTSSSNQLRTTSSTTTSNFYQTSSGGTTVLQNDSGQMAMYTGGSERMRIDSDGNLRVGVGNTFEPVMQFTNSGRVEGNPGFTFNGDLDTGMFNPSIQGTIAFSNNGSESMRIDASGTLLVGTTDSDPSNNSANSSADNGIASFASGEFVSTAYKATANTGSVGYFNRTGTDGAVLEFRKSGSSVGIIGTLDGNSIYIGNGDVNLRMIDVTDDIRPVSSTGTNRDAQVDLGDANARFKDLYLSGGAYLGGTASANLLDDYETGNFDPHVTTANSDMSGITYISQIGSYVKVGDLVWFRLQVGFSATTIGTGNFRITDLPFVSKNDAEARQAAQVLTYNLTWDSTWQQIGSEGVQNSSSIDFLISRSGSTWANLKATDMSNSTTYYYIVSGCYQTV